MLILAGKGAVVQDQVDVARRDPGRIDGRLDGLQSQIVRLFFAADAHAAESKIVQGPLSRQRTQRCQRGLHPEPFPLQNLRHGLFVGRHGISRCCNAYIEIQNSSSRSAAKPPLADVRQQQRVASSGVPAQSQQQVQQSTGISYP